MSDEEYWEDAEREYRAGGTKKAKVVKLRPEFGDWRDSLARSPDGKIMPTENNAMRIFAGDDKLRGVFAYNEFLSSSVITRSPPETVGSTCPGPFPRGWEEDDRVLCLSYFQETYNQAFKAVHVTNAIKGAAHAARFHPVRDYLDSLAWDGTKRIGSWLSTVFGAPMDLYHYSVGSKFLRAAVRRVREPGCKFDSMLILEGAQDLGKSRVCRALFSDNWFTDNLPPDLSGKEISGDLQGVWGVEFAEIEHLLRLEPEVTKAFLSRQFDRYRPPYGVGTVKRQRQCVFMGTTNKDDYARDETGNRRLWPVYCRKADADWIIEWRDQLWAEAAATEAGTALWLDDEDARAEARAQQAARHDDDPWDDGIRDFLASCSGFITIPKIMKDHLEIPIEKQDKRAQMRVARCMKRLGWFKNEEKIDGKARKVWRRVGDEPDDEGEPVATSENEG